MRTMFGISIGGISSAATAGVLLLGGGSIAPRQAAAAVDVVPSVSPPTPEEAKIGRPGADGSGDRRGDGQRQSSSRSPPLPQCYAGAAANPSFGAWRKCEGGEAECSPIVHLETWAHANLVAGHYKLCTARWGLEHEGEGLMPYWAWEPSTCKLEEVDAEKFCQVVAPRKGLLFVGDSLTGEMTVTLAAMLRAEHVNMGDPTSLYAEFIGCDGNFNFLYVRNDYLDARTTKFPADKCTEHSKTRCGVFADDSTLGKYDTIVVNAGAHRRPGGIERYGEAMRKTSALLSASMKRLHGDQAILIVRNTVPGHPGSYAKTFDGPMDAAEVENFLDELPTEYGWQLFTTKNKILEDAFRASDGWVMLDAFSPTVMRSDMHGRENDGLHYCIPGPIDHWVSLLHNIMLVQTSMKD